MIKKIQLPIKIKMMMRATGKPYGGKIYNARFFTCEGPKFEGLTEFIIVRGNLVDDPNNRFGWQGNMGMRTSYIVNQGPDWVETRNTIYQIERAKVEG